MMDIQRLRIVLYLTPGCAPAIVRELGAAATVRRVEREGDAALALQGGAQLLVTDKESWAAMTASVRQQVHDRRQTGMAKIVVLADRGIKSTLSYVQDIDQVLAFDEPPQQLTEALFRLVESVKTEPTPSSPGLAPATPTPPGSRTQRLLIVDDSRLGNRIVSAVLTAAGYQVTCLTNPFEMRTWVQENTPDLVLVDYNIPALRGDQLIEINRRTGLSVPMVLYSNSTPYELAILAKKCGAIGYILKGVSGESLLEQLDRVFARLNQDARESTRDPA
jgi:CheY-like chemotaxis protein